MIIGPKVVVHRSTFVGAVQTVQGSVQVRDIVRDMKQADRRARHVAWAFRLDGTPVEEGMTDDGEPRGTAGMPLLELLRHRDALNLLVTVTRHFGGVKLGPGNLRRAYKEAAKAALGAWEADEGGKER